MHPPPVQHTGICAAWVAMAVIIEYPDTMALRQLRLLNMPFPEVVKYSILGVSVLLLLLAIAIFLWQIFRCRTRTNAVRTTSRYSARTGAQEAKQHVHNSRGRYTQCRFHGGFGGFGAEFCSEFCPLSCML